MKYFYSPRGLNQRLSEWAPCKETAITHEWWTADLLVVMNGPILKLLAALQRERIRKLVAPRYSPPKRGARFWFGQWRCGVCHHLTSDKGRNKKSHLARKQSVVGNESEMDVGSQPFDQKRENMRVGTDVSGLLSKWTLNKLLLLSGQPNIIKETFDFSSHF